MYYILPVLVAAAMLYFETWYRIPSATSHPTLRSERGMKTCIMPPDCTIGGPDSVFRDELPKPVGIITVNDGEYHLDISPHAEEYTVWIQTDRKTVKLIHGKSWLLFNEDRIIIKGPSGSTRLFFGEAEKEV